MALDLVSSFFGHLSLFSAQAKDDVSVELAEKNEKSPKKWL
jgi:hypothetical protein